MNESYYITFYKRIVDQQTNIAQKAINNNNLAKAKVAFTQLINAYKELIKNDPANKAEYNDAIRDIQDKIDNVANLKPAPVGASGGTSNSGQSTSNNSNKSSSGPQKPSNSASTNQNKDEKKAAESNKGSADPNEDELKEALKELNDLIGLDEVKKQINEWVKQVKVFQLRKARGIENTKITYHMVFTGNPGTGKTTVARLVSKIYHSLGICAVDHTEEVDRGKLVAGYVGQTATKTQEAIDKAMGGILFVDEAYTLKQDERDTFGQEAIDSLLKAMEDKRDELVVIAAGYEEDMKRFISSNPGLASRFKNFINFTDYNGDDLFKIIMKQLDKYDYIIDESCEKLLKKYFNNLYKNRDANFGNARTVRNFFETLVTCQSSRLATKYDDLTRLDDVELKTITPRDIEAAIKQSNADYDEEFQKIEDTYRSVKSELPDEVLQKLIDDDFRRNGMFDQSVVKLCVRLDSILRYKYRLDGDLFTMIHSLIKQKGNEQKYQILHKLRMARNACVHPNNNNDDDETDKRIMSLDEVQQAFNLIKELDE